MHAVSALKFILARVGKGFNCHIVFVPCSGRQKTQKRKDQGKQEELEKDEKIKPWKVDGVQGKMQIVERTDRTDFEVRLTVMCVVDLPDDPWVGPATDSAMQSHTLLLPHCVGARFNHKLRGVHQAVFVHTLEVLLVFMDLKIAEEITLPLPTMN